MTFMHVRGDGRAMCDMARLCVAGDGGCATPRTGRPSGRSPGLTSSTSTDVTHTMLQTVVDSVKGKTGSWQIGTCVTQK